MRRRRSAAACVVWLSLALACGGGEESSGTGGPPAAPPAPAPSRWSDEPDDRPLLSILANRGTAELFRGWPLVVEVQLLLAQVGQEGAAARTIASPTGPWSNAVQLTVADASGALQSWPLQLEGSAEASLRLDGESGGLLVFTLAPEQTGAIAEGSYELGAVLDTTTSPEPSWRGRVQAVATTLRVAAEPPEPSPERAAEKQLAQAHYELARGDPAAAEAVIDELLRARPEDVRALAWKAGLRAGAGQADEARALYDQALAAYWTAHPDAEEPPAFLEAPRAALGERLFEPEAPRP